MQGLKVTNLKKNFGKTEALKGISFTVGKGQIFGFLGPNGAGKSTTLRCIMGYIRPNDGSITVFGQSSTANGTGLKEIVSYVPSEPNLYKDWTAEEHIRFISKLQPVDDNYVSQLKERLQLASRQKVGELSTGNQQKVALVLALITKPKLLLLDEPTRGLDPLLRNELHSILRDYQKSGGTVLLSSHDLSEVEELCSNLAIIKDGLLVTDDSIKRLKESKTHKVTATFSGKVPRLSALNISEITTSGKTLTFNLKGDLNKLVTELSKHRLKDLEIIGASLEDIFMEIYN